MQREVFVVSEPNHRAMRALNYTPAVDALKRACGSKTVIPVGDAVSELGLGYATVFARLDCAPEHGVELLSQSDMFAAEPAGRWIRRDSMNRPERHEVRRWQILIAGAGTLGQYELYGRPMIADKRLTGKYVGQDTLVLAFDPPGSDLNLYVYAFLASPTGLKALRSASYGTKILRIRKDILGELPIPASDAATIARIAGLIRETVLQRETYAEALTEARGVLEALPDMCEALELCDERRARCIAWADSLPTLRAWNYASAGTALDRLRRAWCARLRDVVVKIKAKSRFARIPCEAPHGVELVSQRDVFMMRRLPQRVVRPAVPDAELFADPSTIIVARDGQFSEGSLFGRAEIAGAGLTGSALSEHLMQLIPKRPHAAVLYAYLSTSAGHRLTRTTAVGTSIPTIREDLFLDLPFPELDQAASDRVDNAVKTALAARLRADQAEQNATRIIEDEVLPQWLA